MRDLLLLYHLKKISAFSSGDLNKYEFLKRIDLNYKPNVLDKARFGFFPLGKTFSAGLDKTAQGYQEEGIIKLLKDIKNSLARPPRSNNNRDDNDNDNDNDDDDNDNNDYDNRPDNVDDDDNDYDNRPDNDDNDDDGYDNRPDNDDNDDDGYDNRPDNDDNKVIIENLLNEINKINYINKQHNDRINNINKKMMII